MAAVFTFVPSTSLRKQVKARNIVAQFGEGYAQRTAESINTQTNSWSVSFVNQPIDTATAIEDFLSTAGTRNLTAAGNTYYLWTPPNSNTQYKVICDSWDVEDTYHISRTINTTFNRVFDL